MKGKGASGRSRFKYVALLSGEGGTIEKKMKNYGRKGCEKISFLVNIKISVIS
ncbi:MAG: hypothetical protein JRH08_01280 [Deltaproteobacteria bacterium]|nr:hypothetical protein [Deltaproteobacteria bacterium]